MKAVHRLFKRIDISLLSSFSGSINLQNIISHIEVDIPEYLFSEIDVIYVGNFDFLTNEFKTSKFMENAIYLSDTIPNNEDVLYNIIKSLSDSLEEKNIHIIFENIQVIEEINMDDSFSDILVDYLLYDKDLVKKEKPRCYRLIQEIIKNESC
jgi:hypothetical protein|tara:strand:- start:460 stop:918 length:459 start_codon:yes stop_codon:yes gene_type:complete